MSRALRRCATVTVLSIALWNMAGEMMFAQERMIIKPGQEVQFSVNPLPQVTLTPKVFGTIAGRKAEIFDTKCSACEMGKVMIADADDNVWFLLTREDKIAKVDTKRMVMQEYQLPVGSGPYSAGIDSKGVMWLSAHGIEMLLEFDPKAGKITSHAPPSHGFLVHVNVNKATDTVFFAQPGANMIVSYNRAHGFKEYHIPTPQSGPARLDFDASGKVWFPELYRNKLARLDPETGDVQEWDLPGKDGFPSFARVDGSNAIWVSQPMEDRIVRFSDGKFAEYKVPTENSIVSTQQEDSDGFIWFTEGGWRGSAGGNAVGRLNPKTGHIEELRMPVSNAQPAGIVITKRGDVWFQLSARGKIVRLSPEKMSP